MMRATIVKITNPITKMDEDIAAVGEDIRGMEDSLDTLKYFCDGKTENDDRIKMIRDLIVAGFPTSPQDTDEKISECEASLKRLETAAANYRRVKRNMTSIITTEEIEARGYENTVEKITANKFKTMLEKTIAPTIKRRENGGELAGFDVTNFPILFSNYAESNIFKTPLSSMIVPLPIGGGDASAFVVGSFEFINRKATHRLLLYLDSGRVDTTTTTPPLVEIRVETMDLTNNVILSSQGESTNIGQTALISFRLLPQQQQQQQHSTTGDIRVGLKIIVACKEATLPFIWSIIFKEN